jgi:hypothetical protein
VSRGCQLGEAVGVMDEEVSREDEVWRWVSDLIKLSYSSLWSPGLAA